MERKLIESIIWGIIRTGVDTVDIIVDGIALLLCRNHDQDLRLIVPENEFDYEFLFSKGNYVVGRIEKLTSDEQLRILYYNFKESVTALYNIVQRDRFQFRFGVGDINESASPILMSILSPTVEATVYNPFGGDPYASLSYPTVTFSVDTMSPQKYRFTMLYLVSRGHFNMKTRAYDPLSAPKNSQVKYDFIYVPAFPFGMKTIRMGHKIEETFALNLIQKLSDWGRMLMVLPIDSLSADKYFELRKTLAELKILRSITLFASGAIYPDTGIKTAAFLIDKSYRKDYFILTDAASFDPSSNEDSQKLIARLAGEDPTISKTIKFVDLFSTTNCFIRDFSISSSRIARPGFKYIKLKDVLQRYTNKVTLSGDEMVAKLTGKNMHVELPLYQIDVQDVEISHVQGSLTKIVEPVFCFHGITLKYVWCIGEEDLPIYCNSDIYTFQIKSRVITPEYLCFILHEEDITQDIRSRVGGSIIPRISIKSLLDIEIPIPAESNNTLMRQEIERFISEYKTQLAEAEKRSHQESIEDIKDDIKDKVHLLGPYNSDIQAGLNKIKELLNAGKLLDANSKVYKKSNIRLIDFITNLFDKSVSSGYILESIGGSIFETISRPMDSFVFLQEYQASLQRDDTFEDISIELSRIAAPYALMIHPKSLQFVLDTIVRNAIMHGFAEPFDGEKRIRISICQEDGFQNAILSIANNGNPVDRENFTEELYGQKSGMCGDYAHSGRGGYFVNRAMEFYGGRYTIDTSDAEWPFIINLFIPISHE